MGEFTKMPFPEYLALPYMSVHGLKLFSEDPIAYLLSFNKREDKSTPALDEGKAFHCRILEPETYLDLFAEAPDVSKTTKEGKALWQAFNEQNRGKTILKHDTVQEIEYMAAAVRANPRAMELLSGGTPELSGIWEDERGFTCKIRCDYLKVDEYGGIADISDLKTVAGNIVGPSFVKEIANRLYHWQAYFYRKGVAITYPSLEQVNFHFIVVSKQSPYRCRVFEINDQDVAAVGITIEKHLSNFAVYMQSDVEQWFIHEEQKLNLPPWAL